MFKKTKGVMIGILIGLMLGGTAAVAAGNTTTLYDVINSGVRIVIDGQELHPTDVNGNKVEPMIYNGTTYLPVRAVAGALGKAVYWDGPSFTVYLGDMDGELEYPTVYLKDMKSISQSNPTSSKERTDNYGTVYDNAVSSGKWEFLLDMKYTHFKGTFYVPNGTTSDLTRYFTVTADGHVIYTSPELTKTSRPVAFDVDVTGYNDVKIVFKGTTDYGGNYLRTCLADAGFYQ